MGKSPHKMSINTANGWTQTIKLSSISSKSVYLVRKNSDVESQGEMHIFRVYNLLLYHLNWCTEIIFLQETRKKCLANQNPNQQYSKHCLPLQICIYYSVIYYSWIVFSGVRDYRAIDWLTYRENTLPKVQNVICSQLILQLLVWTKVVFGLFFLKGDRNLKLNLAVLLSPQWYYLITPLAAEQ